MTRDEFEAGVQDALEAEPTEPFSAALDADPAALAEYVDHLQLHQRLGVLLQPERPELVDSVLRELRYTGDSERFAKGVVGQLKEKGGFRRRWLELAAAAFALAALGFFLLREGVPTPAADGAELLLVVGQVPLDAGDLRVKERLERTHRVQVRPAREARPEDARGRALVLISSTIDEREVRERFRDVDVPVLCWEPRLFHDLGMIPGAVHRLDWAAAEGQTRLRTAAGTVTVTSQPAPYCWARVRADAEKVATLESDPDKAAIFRYDRGAAMPGLKAPARRAGVFLFEWTAIALTPEGWALFDDSVRWCIGR
jgi:hypothetical protein